MALLTYTGLETHPTGTINVGGIINGNWNKLEAIFSPTTGTGDDGHAVAWNAINGQAALTTIAYAATVAVDMAADYEICSVALGGNLTVAVDEKTAGRHRWLILRGDGSDRNITWPAGAKWAGPQVATVDAGTVAAVLIIATGTANADLILCGFGGSGGATPSWEDQDIPAQITASDEDPAVDAGDWSAFAEVPSGRVDVLISQTRFATVGNAAKTKDCYFSADGGTTALAHAAIATATSLHWMGSIAGYQLTASDTVSLKYAS